MSVTRLNARRKKILQAIVEAYIETASPISSQTIAQMFRSRISAATIRNVMVELDKLGLIWQPHTSAGRIPTDKGYRYYIDSQLELGQLTQSERELIASHQLGHHEAFDELLREVLQILANFTEYTALAFSPGLRKILLKKLELVCVQSTKILVVMVSLEGVVKTTVVQLPYKIEQTELLKIAKFLSEEFKGMSLDEIKVQLTRQLLARGDTFFYLLKKAADILDLTFASFDKDELYLEGANYIFGQPEFQDAQKLQAILRTFKQEEPLLKIMQDDLGAEGVRVHIGKENLCLDIQECSLVISNFKNRNCNMGTLGIIGPRRMSYSKVIATVGYAAQSLSERIANLGL